LVIIAPESISTKPVINQQIIDEAIAKYSATHNVRILVTHRPEGESWRSVVSRYLFGMDFNGCVSAVMAADVFIGNDSGLAWVSLFNKNCKKFIYHTKERIRLVNTWFEQLDPTAKDIVL
jgi:hypothetical protein